MIRALFQTWRGERVVFSLSREAATYLQDVVAQDIEATADARGLTLNDKNIVTTDELLDILEDYDTSASYQREILKCLNSLPT